MSTTGDNSPPVLRRDDGAVAILTLNRPAARNSLSRGMLAELQAMLDTVAADSGIRAVVLAAEGPAFSAGHDLKEITAHRADADGGAGILRRLHGGLLGGDAVGGDPAAAGGRRGPGHRHRRRLPAGRELRPGGRLPVGQNLQPGVDIGLFCSTPGVALARAVPRKPAMEMLLLGEMVPAEEAHRIGLVNRVVAPEAVLPTALDLARRIASRSAVAVQLGKRGFNSQVALPLAEAYAAAGAVMVENLLAEDAAEGIGAFVAKRPPQWRHR